MCVHADLFFGWYGFWTLFSLYNHPEVPESGPQVLSKYREQWSQTIMRRLGTVPPE